MPPCFSTSSSPSHPLLDQRVPPPLSSCSSVSEWLRSIKMERYEQNFLQAGFTRLDVVSQLNTEYVEKLNTCFRGNVKLTASQPFMDSFVLQGPAPSWRDLSRSPEEDPLLHPDTQDTQSHAHPALLTTDSPTHCTDDVDH